MKANRVVDIVIPVYNDNPYLAETLASIFIQQLPEGWVFHVVVVDDGSEIPIELDVLDEHKGLVSVVRLDKNQGCSVARNKGAAMGEGDAVLFLDADCSLAHVDVLALLLEQYNQGFEVCFGQIHAPQGDFWAKYQNDVAQERAERFKQGDRSTMTTAIFMVKRSVFDEAGGFDENYHFGFEDRDLFISLIKLGARVSLVEKALVNHNDQLSFVSVTRKLYEAGKIPSIRFIAKHPDDYAKMSYAKADVRFSNGWLKIVVLLSKPITSYLIVLIGWCIEAKILPYFVVKSMVKYISGLSYLHGSYDAMKVKSTVN